MDLETFRNIYNILLPAWQYNAWVCVVGGTLGNLVAIVVLLSNRQLWQYIATLYLLVLAIVRALRSNFRVNRYTSDKSTKIGTDGL